MAVYMTPDEVRAFGDKLDSFGKGLTPSEQVLLREILVRAARESATDVSGYLQDIPDNAPLSNYVEAVHALFRSGGVA